MKEAVKTIVIVILAAVSVYFAMKFDQVNSYMQVLDSQDSLQTIQVDNFDHNLKDLSLMFDGRGKHIQEFQAALADMDEKLNNTNRKFNKKIDSLGVIIADLTYTVDNKFAKVDEKLNDLSERLTEVQRSSNRQIQDINTTLAKVSREVTAVKKDVKDLQDNKMDKPTEESNTGRRR